MGAKTVVCRWVVGAVSLAMALASLVLWAFAAEETEALPNGSVPFLSVLIVERSLILVLLVFAVWWTCERCDAIRRVPWRDAHTSELITVSFLGICATVRLSLGLFLIASSSPTPARRLCRVQVWYAYYCLLNIVALGSGEHDGLTTFTWTVALCQRLTTTVFMALLHSVVLFQYEDSNDYAMPDASIGCLALLLLVRGAAAPALSPMLFYQVRPPCACTRSMQLLGTVL